MNTTVRIVIIMHVNRAEQGVALRLKELIKAH